MNTRLEAYKISEIFSLKENQELPKDVLIALVEDRIIDVYEKGRLTGRANAIVECRNAVNNIHQL